MTHYFHGTAASGGALLLAALTALAVASRAGTGVPCTAITDDAERLACYDRALRGAAPPAATPSAAAPPAAANPTPSAAPAAAAAAPAAAAATAPITTQPERTVRESTAPAAPAARRGQNERRAANRSDRHRRLRALPGPRNEFHGRGRHGLGADGQPTRRRHARTRRSTPRSSPAPWAATSSCPKNSGRAIRVRAAD